MPNRIKGTDTSAVDTGASRPVERLSRVAPVSSAAAQAPRPGDSVSITDAARRLTALQAQIAQVPEVDAGRVTELRQAIDQGKYRANPGVIADKLMKLESDVAAATRQQKQA